MVQTYRNLAQRELGFSSDDLLAVEFNLPSRKASQHVQIYQDLVDRFRLLPNVEHASAASFVPLTGVEHVFPVESGKTPVAVKFFVPGYFQTMRTPILEGERFVPGERISAPNPVLVSRSLARRLYPAESAIGKPIRRLNENGSIVAMRDGPTPPFAIAGVVADVREMTIREQATEVLYIPVIDPRVEQSIVPTNMRLVVRTRGPVASLASSAKQLIADVDPDLSVGRIEAMDTIVTAARAGEGFVGLLLLAAAAVSLFVGATGIYGSVAQVVRRRTREIGIRLALGAPRSGVVRMVTSGSIKPVLIGAMLGLALWLPAGQLLSSLLFGVEPYEPKILLTATAALIVSAAAAALLAARQAARLDPHMALRSE